MLRSALQSFGTLHAHPPLALPGQRIGLMGGTFNPPHEGHVICAETALKRLKLDQLWWIVTPATRSNRRRACPSLESRMAASRALAADPAIKVTGFEAELGSPYTYATVRYVRRRFARTRFVWVMGADNLAALRPLAALARDRPTGADRRGRPPRLASEGAGLARRAGAITLALAGIGCFASSPVQTARLGVFSRLGSRRPHRPHCGPAHGLIDWE